MSHKRYIGIDPGKNGCIAIVNDLEGTADRITYCPLSATPGEILDWLRVNTTSYSSFAVLEKVGGFVRGNPTPGSTMFQFGRGYGELRMALLACEISHEEVTPQVWQRGLKIPKREKEETDTAWKNRLRQHARQLFPGEQITLARADALLIAEYCRRKREGTL